MHKKHFSILNTTGHFLISIFLFIMIIMYSDNKSTIYLTLMMITQIISINYSNILISNYQSYFEIIMSIISTICYLSITFIFCVEFILSYNPLKFHIELDTIIILLILFIISEPIITYFYKKKYYYNYYTLNI